MTKFAHTWPVALTLLGRTWDRTRAEAQEADYGTKNSLMQLQLRNHRMGACFSATYFDNRGFVRATAVGTDLGIVLSNLETDLALQDTAPPSAEMRPSARPATFVFTNLVLALLRNARGDALEALEELQGHIRERRFPEVRPVAHFVCELEEAER